MLDYQSGHTARSIHRYYADVEVDIVFKDATSQALRTFLDGSNWALVTINAALFTHGFLGRNALFVGNDRASLGCSLSVTLPSSGRGSPSRGPVRRWHRSRLLTRDKHSHKRLQTFARLTALNPHANRNQDSWVG
jgi:hypothetical protein